VNFAQQPFALFDCIQSKGLFPYEAFDITNYDEVLSKSKPFPKDDFYSTFKETTISESDYNTYFEKAKCHQTG
jgi:hypothetical protein